MRVDDVGGKRTRDRWGRGGEESTPPLPRNGVNRGEGGGGGSGRWRVVGGARGRAIVGVAPRLP